ncbi:MAG: type II secretion system protein GspG [Thermoanaerobaculia bacterium]
MKRTFIVLFAAITAFSAFGDDDTILANQKVAMADIRTLATALEAYATDNNHYPDVTLDALAQLLSPTYIMHVPMTDRWGTPFLYVGDGEDRYRFVSAGADGVFEESSRALGPLQPEKSATDDPNADIVFEDGGFIQYPAALAPKPRTRPE